MAQLTTSYGKLRIIGLAAAAACLLACGSSTETQAGGGGGGGGDNAGGSGAGIRHECTAVASAPACEPTPPDCADYPAASVTLGVGTELNGYVYADDGEELQLELGSMGVYSGELAIRVTGAYPGQPGRRSCQADPLIVAEAWHNGERIGRSEPGYYGLNETAAGYELTGISLVLDNFDHIEKLVGEDIELIGHVTDYCGNCDEDSLTARVPQ